MADDHRCSISLQSVSSGFMYTPSASILSGQSTDEFEFLGDSDEEADDDDSDSEARSTSTTSLSASVYAYEYEHGRRYHSFKSGRYPFPNDLPEQRREETLHTLMLEIAEGHVFYSNVGEWPQKIIDIGTGTGTWAIDVADMYPGASVVGTDLSPIQPTWLPVNLRMFVEDCEDPDWLHGGSFDLVHFRDVAGALRDLHGVLGKVHPQIAPGGWVEFQDIEPEIFCDDATMSPNDALRSFFKISTSGLRAYGCQSYPCLPVTIRTALSHAGFTNIQVVAKKIPISGWARDKKLRAAGVLAKEFVADSIEAMAAKPLAALELSAKERRSLVVQARRSLDDERPHRYLKMNFVYAQKVEEALVSDSESYMS